MKVAVLVLNWNDATRTISCLKSLLEQSIEEFEVFVMDNASELKDFQELESFVSPYPRVHLSSYNENLGFCGAHLKLWESGELDDFDFLMLLNNDAVADSNCLETLVEEIVGRNLDMAACKMLQLHQPELIDSFGLFMLNTGEILPRGFGKPTASFVQNRSCIGPSGGGCMYSVKMLKEIGWFDPHFSTGYEDAEFALRAFLAGYSCEAIERAVVLHEGSVSINKIRDEAYLTYVQKSIWYSFFKNMPRVYLLWNLPSILFKVLFILLMYGLTFNSVFLRIHLSAISYLFSANFRKDLARNETKKASFARALEATQFFVLFDLQRFAQLIKK